MRLIGKLATLMGLFIISGCLPKGSNPADPYEPINRKIHDFNMAFDATMLRPPAKLYKSAIPAPIRSGINNAYNNVNMLPTMANDILQAKWNQTIKDAGRFMINTTLGIAGIIDVATIVGVPPHSNDMGLTFAQWGDKQSPYIVIPFLGPSTIRDGFGMMYDFTFFTPYPYIPSDTVIYSLVLLRYVDLRAQMLETDRLLGEALDKYSFIRDAYLQRRNFLITGQKPEALGSLYVDDEDDDLLVEEPADGTPSEFPITTAYNVAHSTPSA